MKLYEIATAYNQLDQAIDDPEELKTYLDGINTQLQEKAVNIFRVMKNLESPVLAIDEEIKRLQAMKKHYQSQADSLKDYISHTMQKNGIEKIESDLVKFSFRKSTQVIVDEKAIDPKYIKEKIVKSVDKMAIKEDLKNGYVKGAVLKEVKNLQIK